MPVGNFDFANPTRIIFGKGQIAALPKYLPKDRIIVMTYGGGSIKANGTYDQVMKALEGYDIREFGGIEANPDFETLMKCVAMVKEIGADKVYLLSVGGGSVLDGTKFIAAASYYDHSDDAWEILETGGRFVGKCVPLADVLTLPATGSEANKGAVISWRARNEKRGFHHDNCFPVFSILDPLTTLSLPTKQTANGVADSIVHVCEQYVTKCIHADVQDRFAEALIEVLLDNGRVVMENPNDYAARSNIMWAATWALNEWINQGVAQDWATHMIGHELTAFLGIDHGHTLAIIQPRLFRHCFEQKKEKLAQLGRRVFKFEGEVDAVAAKVIDALESFYNDVLKLPTRISQVNVPQDKAWIDKAVEKFESRGVRLTENQDVAPEDVRKIILDSY